MTQSARGNVDHVTKRIRLLGRRPKATRKAMTLQDLVKEGVSLLAGIATVIGVAGAIVAVLEYTGQGEAERAAASLQLVDAWEDDGYRASFDRLSAELAAEIAKMPPAELEELHAAAPDEQAVVLSRLGDDYLGSSDGKAVDDLFYFFTKLTICVSANLCSAHAIDAFFEEPIRSFWTYFSGYAERRRSLYPAFAADVELYATRK